PSVGEKKRCARACRPQLTYVTSVWRRQAPSLEVFQHSVMTTRLNGSAVSMKICWFTSFAPGNPGAAVRLAARCRSGNTLGAEPDVSAVPVNEHGAGEVVG